jgi:hypothetical protein
MPALWIFWAFPQFNIMSFLGAALSFSPFKCPHLILMILRRSNARPRYKTVLYIYGSFSFSTKLHFLWNDKILRCYKHVFQVYHPNIDLEGNVCLNILREDWKPVLNINTVIYGLNLLFTVFQLSWFRSYWNKKVRNWGDKRVVSATAIVHALLSSYYYILWSMRFESCCLKK